MDSNAPPQSRGTPYSACHFVSPQAREKSATAEPDCNRFLSAFGMTATWKFSFARGTPVIAKRRSGISYPVFPFVSSHSEGQGTEESAALKQIRNDRKERPVRDRPLLKLRDGPSWHARGDPRWYARGKPPARSEPEKIWNVIPCQYCHSEGSMTEESVCFKQISCPAYRRRVSRHVGTRGSKKQPDDWIYKTISAPQSGDRSTKNTLFGNGQNLPRKGNIHSVENQNRIGR